MGNRAAKQALFDEFARVGKVLASGRRIELLDVLANGERTVEGLARQLELSVANTSQHLQVLRQAGLVATRREGTAVHYRLAPRLEEGDELVVLDVRPTEEHAAGHLPGAVSIPLAELRERLRELPGDREIVAYCRGPFCAFAHEAIAVLTDAGLTARRLEDGLPEWAAAGLAVTRS